MSRSIFTSREIDNLSDEDFDKLAREQVIKYPHLLLFDNEEGVVRCFYNHYHRVRKCKKV